MHLAKGGDGGDCSNYRPLRLVPVIDKLFAKLLSERIARVVCLHDQQYAFRSGRGKLNPLHNLLAVVRQRTQAKKATYTCLFDAATAYGSVPRTLLLHRLLQCGVTGPAFAVLAAIYTRRHPAGCGLGQPSPRLLRCNAGSHKGAPCPAAVCNLCRPCAAGHASPVAPRPVMGGTGCHTADVGGPGIRG